jgi:hypothetical protein
MAVARSETIVVATARDVTDSQATFKPEAFLKGAVTAGDLVLSSPDRTSTCAPAEFVPGERYLLLLRGSAWPIDGSVLQLVRGEWLWLGVPLASEAELIDEIREVTGQYAVPAQSDSEGQGIDWWKTVLPVGGAVLGIFVVGLFLMRIWHRIDPS